MLRQVSLPAVEAPSRRLAAFKPVRKVLAEEREEQALRQDPRMSQPPGPEPSPPRRAPPPEPHETALFVVMPDGSVARAAIGSASKWEQMLGRYAQTAARHVAVQTANAIAIVAGGREERPGERAESRSQALVAVRSDGAPVRALAGDEPAPALGGGAPAVPAASAGRRGLAATRETLPTPPPLTAPAVVVDP